MLALTPAQAEPYVVLRTRSMLFEEAVMRYLGITDIPTFDHPAPATTPRPPGSLGHACRGDRIEPCRTWLQARAPKRTVEGRELRVLVDDQKLETILCRVCKG